MTTFHRVMPSPIGDLAIVAGEDGRVRRIEFLVVDDLRSVVGDPVEDRPGGPTERAVRQLEEYFAGRRRDFDLELAPHGSPFQLRVWRHLEKIPYGETRSYGELAAELGRPGAARAVGRANATNPIPIVVPCHRVVGADGSLTGYAGGLAIKRALLELEGWRPSTASGQLALTL